ncbi:hypothetical protein BDZ45DRAFT_732591 [Acephala macrosclerotiorum]|nr:hypothetical protein BDZ45DRAFT_732591 [Acephala macrosclerotiorum]
MATYSQTTWDGHKAAITQLYAIKTLQQVMDEMKERHGFTATKKQWKTQLSKWSLDKKNIKPAEYRAMVRKKREREENNPEKGTQFILHGIEVPPDKIARFESREGRNKGVNGRQGDALTPPGLACRTPPIKQDSGDIRSHPTISMATTCNSAAADDRSLIQTQLVLKDLTASMQTIQPRLSTRSPSCESFDWFKEYIDYSESINGSPTTSGNPFMEILLRFQKVPDNYENERAYKSFTEGLYVEHPCNYCRTLETISQLQQGLIRADEKMTPMTIENWAQTTMKKAIQSKNDDMMVMVGYAIGGVYIDLGRLWEAKLYLEQTIFEMKRLDTPLGFRKLATISLANSYSKLGNIQRADELLKVLFKTEYPKIVASSYLFLENCCQEHRIRLLKKCYSKTRDDLVQDVNDTLGYSWEEDGEELDVRVAAATLVRELNPGIIEETGGCDANGSECSGAANDELGDELDEDMQSDEDIQSDEQ